jgi:thioredoxin 1
MDSVVGEIADEMAGSAIVGKIYPKQRELFQEYKVRGVPTFLVVKDGEVKKSFVGGRSKNVLLRELKRHVSSR